MKRISIIVIIIVILAGVVSFFFDSKPIQVVNTQGGSLVPVDTIPASKTFNDSFLTKFTSKEHEGKPGVRLVFVGDIMLDRGVLSSVRRNFDGDFKSLFEHLSFLQEPDILFGNLEGPISDEGRNVGSIYSFRMDPKIGPILKEAGFDVVSFANNHVGDWGSSAFRDTLDILESADIFYTGAGKTKESARTPVIITTRGVRVGYIGFTDVGPNWLSINKIEPGILLAEDPQFESIIGEARKSVDILVVSFHWGAEYSGVSERQRSLARRAIDAGGALVVGHHPHIIQETEIYNGHLIAYSLGNFIFDQYFSEHTMRGMLLSVLVDADGIIDHTSAVVELDRTYQPVRVRELTTSDVVRKRITTPDLCPHPKESTTRNIFVPVSPQYSVGSYVPPKLIHMVNRVDARGSATCLDEEAGLQFEKLANASLADGMKIVMTSGYRSHTVQEMLPANSSGSEQKGEYASVAKPGHSEHQLGTAVDMKSGSIVPFEYSSFIKSPEYVWLTKNAHTFGFVQSYPEGKESITGYISEPWHWRYIGPDLAEEYLASGKTLVEFLQKREKKE